MTRSSSARARRGTQARLLVLAALVAGGCEQHLVVGRHPDRGADGAAMPAESAPMADAGADLDGDDRECSRDTDCSDGDDRYCDVAAGECVECLEDAHCRDGGVCVDDDCEECRASADCADGGVCDEGQCMGA